jgi:hypothetical protein
MLDSTILATADGLPSGVKVLKRLGATLDLLIFDVSMFEKIAVNLLPLFAEACPRATMLVITSLVRKSLDEYPQLRKPFSDQDVLQAVNQVLATTHLAKTHSVVGELDAKPKPPRSCRSNGVQGRALGRLATQ